MVQTLPQYDVCYSGRSLIFLGGGSHAHHKITFLVIPVTLVPDQETDLFSGSGKMDSIPIENRMLKRSKALDVYSYDGLIKNVASRRLLYVSVIKELIDNALDAKAQTVNISLIEESDSLILTISSDTTFFRRAISATFASFDSFTSTKFRKLPTRGTLGNALKVVCGAPYALAQKYNQGTPAVLLTIRTPEGLHKILPPKNEGDSDPVLEFSDEPTSPMTEIAIKLPYVASESYAPPLSYTRDFLIPEYFVFNPWVKFTQRIGKESVEYAPIAKARPYEVTRPSIHWFGIRDFTRLISELAENIPREGELSIRDFVSGFRGFSAPDSQRNILQSLGIGNISLVSLASDDEKIKNLYDEMKLKSAAPEPETLGHLGKDAISAALKQIFPGMSESVFYQCSRKSVEEGDHQIPYVIEAAVARLDEPYLYQFYGLNNSPFLLSYPRFPVTADVFDDLFREIKWEWKPKKGRIGKAESYSHFLKQFHLNEKEGAVVVLHVICPNLNTESYAKSKYNLTPIASDLVQVMYDVCNRYVKSRVTPKTAKIATMHLKIELLRRKDLLEKHGSIPQEEWTTQQGIYYKIRKMMNGNIGMKRESFAKAILRECEELFGARSWRERLGIKAAVRAQFFHRGKEDPVSFDSIEVLSQKGSDLLLIEKEGVAEILEPYASKRGVAVLNTRGFAVEYAKRIMEDAKAQRGNVFLLTDWDLEGLLMGKNLPQFRRIGINDSIIELAGRFYDPRRKLVRADVEEDYKPNKNIQSDKLTDAERSEVAKTRVEIDAVLAAVGPAALWKAIEATISEQIKVRDLTRSIEPEIRPPDSIAEPIKRIQDAICEIGEPMLEKNLDPLREWRKGFTDVEKLERRIQNDITSTLSRKRKLRRVAAILSKAAKVLE